MLAEIERIVGESGEAAGKKAKEKAAAPYTGLPFSAGAFVLPRSTTSSKRGAPAAPSKEEEKQTAAASEARRVAVMADITTELLPASTLFRRAAISSIGAEAGKDEEGSGVEGVERKSAGLAEHATEEESEKGRGGGKVSVCPRMAATTAAGGRTRHQPLAPALQHDPTHRADSPTVSRTLPAPLLSSVCEAEESR